MRPAISVRALSFCRKTSAINSSFQTQIACTTISVKVAAPESGMTMRRSTVNGPAPSDDAASMSSCGTVRKKLVRKNTPNGTRSPV